MKNCKESNKGTKNNITNKEKKKLTQTKNKEKESLNLSYFNSKLRSARFTQRRINTIKTKKQMAHQKSQVKYKQKEVNRNKKLNKLKNMLKLKEIKNN